MFPFLPRYQIYFLIFYLKFYRRMEKGWLVLSKNIKWDSINLMMRWRRGAKIMYNGKFSHSTWQIYGSSCVLLLDDWRNFWLACFTIKGNLFTCENQWDFLLSYDCLLLHITLSLGRIFWKILLLLLSLSISHSAWISSSHWNKFWQGGGISSFNISSSSASFHSPSYSGSHQATKLGEH